MLLFITAYMLRKLSARLPHSPNNIRFQHKTVTELSVRHSPIIPFSAISLVIWFYNHSINGLMFLMTARSVKAISSIYHSEASCPGQDANPWDACCCHVLMMLHQPVMPQKSWQLCKSSGSAILKIIVVSLSSYKYTFSPTGYWVWCYNSHHFHLSNNFWMTSQIKCEKFPSPTKAF